MAFAIEILDRSQFEQDIPHAQLFVDASPTWLYISELIPQRIPPLSLKSQDLYQVTNCSETADKQSQEEYINPFHLSSYITYNSEIFKQLCKKVLSAKLPPRLNEFACLKLLEEDWPFG